MEILQELEAEIQDHKVSRNKKVVSCNLQVTDGRRVLKLQHGCELMSLISAAGCTVTAIIAAFLASGKGDTSTDRMLAASFGLGVFGYGSSFPLGEVTSVNLRRHESNKEGKISKPDPVQQPTEEELEMYCDHACRPYPECLPPQCQILLACIQNEALDKLFYLATNRPAFQKEIMQLQAGS